MHPGHTAVVFALSGADKLHLARRFRPIKLAAATPEGASTGALPKGGRSVSEPTVAEDDQGRSPLEARPEAQAPEALNLDPTSAQPEAPGVATGVTRWSASWAGPP